MSSDQAPSQSAPFPNRHHHRFHHQRPKTNLLGKISPPQSSSRRLLLPPTPPPSTTSSTAFPTSIELNQRPTSATFGFNREDWQRSAVEKTAFPVVEVDSGHSDETMNAQMTTIETVTVVRPLKVISLICLIVSLILLLISLLTTYWLKTHSFHAGLFEECVDNIAGAGLNPVPFGPPPGSCQPISRSKVFITFVAVMIITAEVGTFLALIANSLGLKSNDLHRKYVFYKAATYSVLVSGPSNNLVLCELVSLVGFPVVFLFSMNDFGVRNWEFDWSYGVAWGAMLFGFGALMLLICDKEHEEIYHKEKTIYNPPSEFA